MLMEKAGLTPSSPGMVNTPEQMSLQEARVLPHFAAGGSDVHPSGMTPQDMLAYLVASGHLPAHYAIGGGVIKNMAGQAAMTLPGMTEDLQDIGHDIANQNYGPAAIKTGAAGYSAFAPINPEQRI